jgi:hypothetical protein
MNIMQIFKLVTEAFLLWLVLFEVIVIGVMLYVSTNSAFISYMRGSAMALWKLCHVTALVLSVLKGVIASQRIFSAYV